MKEEIFNALTILNKGGVILYPTDTIWGLGCDATNSEAVQKIFDIKQRSDSKTMLILVDAFEMLKQYVAHVPEVVINLLTETTRPLTVIYPDVCKVSKYLIHSDGTTGIRIVNDDFCKQLISQFGKPVVSTSANISGEMHPKSFFQINFRLKQQVDYIVNLRQEEQTDAKPSRIVKVTQNNEVITIRD